MDYFDLVACRGSSALAQSPLVSKTPLLAIVGPTASGKSDLGIALAKVFNGEIINSDSVQVYRRIYIATAKVPLEERRGIPHHLIDIVEPTVNFTAVVWADAARSRILEVELRGRRPFLVGGTGFYLKALTTHFFESPEIDPKLRSRFQAILERRGPLHLHRMLARVDPELAERYSARDWSRVIRALEVYFSSGLKLSILQTRSPETATGEEQRLNYLVLNPPRDALYRRINQRADQMMTDGLVDEVRNLLEAGVPPTAKAFSAHGYRRVVEHLCGRRSFEDAIEQMKLDTRHYAKRQWTWWRKQERTHWLNGFGFEEATVTEAISVVKRLTANAELDDEARA